MRLLLIAVPLLLTLLVSACNRKSVAAAATPPVKSSTATSSVKTSDEEEKMIDFPDEVRERDSEIENAPKTRQGAAMLKEQEEQRKRIAETGIQEVVAELRRTNCNGNCPSYKIQIMTDNSLRYKGINAVDMMGEYTGNIDFNALSEISVLAIRGRFFAMSNSYPERRQAPIDLSANVVTINYKGRKNTVWHWANGPEELVAIEDYLNGLLERATWNPSETKE